jgi:hypothetical protein
MDATTVIAVVCSVLIFAGWVVLPHSATSVKAATSVKPVAVSEERKPVAISA